MGLRLNQRRMKGKLSKQGTITGTNFGSREIQQKFHGKRVIEVVESSSETNTKR